MVLEGIGRVVGTQKACHSLAWLAVHIRMVEIVAASQRTGLPGEWEGGSQVVERSA